MKIDDASLGATNVPFWLSERGEDLTTTRLWLDRPWTAPDGEQRMSLTLADILETVAAYRYIYRELGVRTGDIVVSRLATPIDVYLHWIALAAEGAIAAPVNANLSNDVVRSYSERVGAAGELVDAYGAQPGATRGWLFTPLTDERRPILFTTATADAIIDEREHSYAPDDIVLLCHTSGTTGHPKAVPSSHRGFMTGIRSQMREANCPLFGSTMLNALPAAHHSWFMTVTWALLSGTRLVLASDQSARTLVEDVERFQPDSIRSFSCTLREVAGLGLAPGALRSVGLWMTTGDVSRRRDIAAVAALGTHAVGDPRAVKRAPGMLILDGFGSTELGHLHFSLLHMPGHSHEARCIGRPASFARAAILDESGHELPDGAVGYIAVQSEAVTPGYWKDPERTAAVRRGGFWMTGDVGYRDAFGRYFHLDRHTDVVETALGPVFSTRYEEELVRCIPEIERCAIVGQRTDDGDTAVVCLVETDDTTRDVAAWQRDINAKLVDASLLKVAEVVVVPPGTLPVGPTGKIRKFLVRNLRAQTA